MFLCLKTYFDRQNIVFIHVCGTCVVFASIVGRNRSKCIIWMMWQYNTHSLTHYYLLHLDNTRHHWMLSQSLLVYSQMMFTRDYVSLCILSSNHITHTKNVHLENIKIDLTEILFLDSHTILNHYIYYPCVILYYSNSKYASKNIDFFSLTLSHQ